MVSKLENVKGQLHYALNMAMKPLDKAIELIPKDKLDYKPFEEAMTAAELGYHIYAVSFVYTTGTIKREFSNEDYAIIPFDFSKVKTAREFLEYGAKVREFIQKALDETLTEADMDKEVTYTCWGGVKIKGFESLSNILEEVIHHRAQLCLYLRMLGIKPPFIYDFS